MGKKLDAYEDEGTDFKAIRDGWASLSPLTLDYSDPAAESEIESWNLNS